jgi:hypothetical protein
MVQPPEHAAVADALWHGAEALAEPFAFAWVPVEPAQAERLAAIRATSAGRYTTFISVSSSSDDRYRCAPP